MGAQHGPNMAQHGPNTEQYRVNMGPTYPQHEPNIEHILGANITVRAVVVAKRPELIKNMGIVTCMCIFIPIHLVDATLTPS